MFRLFHFPEDVLLLIVKNCSPQSQAKLTQVDKFFNDIIEKKSLDLTIYKYKSNNPVIHSIGNTQLVLKPTNWVFSSSNYGRLCVKNNTKEVKNLSMLFNEENIEKLIEKMKGDSVPLIQYLKTIGVSGEEIADYLENKYDSINQTTYQFYPRKRCNLL